MRKDPRAWCDVLLTMIILSQVCTRGENALAAETESGVKDVQLAVEG